MLKRLRAFLLALAAAAGVTCGVATAQVPVPNLPCATTTLALCGPITYANNAGVAIVAAATTVVATGVTGKRIYVDYLAGLTTGTNASSTVNFEWSASPTCASGNTLLFTTALALGTATGLVTTAWSDVPAAATAIAGWSPAAKALILPAGYTLCMVTAGTTIAVLPIAFYSQY
jgi:hypothetical protein